MQGRLQKTLASATLAVFGLGLATTSAQSITLDLLEGSDDPLTLLPNALLASNSGINIISGTTTFTGRIGDGSNPNTSQSAVYSNFNLVPNNPGLPTITNPNGIVLTTGVANIPLSNTSSSFDHGDVGVSSPNTGSDLDLRAILAAANAPSTIVNDVNILSFNFTVDNAQDQNSVIADFVFGSDEFPDQSVTDVFAFIVDGTNYARFVDGSLVSFVQGANANNFNDNNVGTNNYNLEYDGISNSLRVVGLLDPSLTEHTLKIAIADTSDSIFDSAVFISNLQASISDTGGVEDPGTSEFFPVFPSVIEPGRFIFEDVESGQWFDPPLAEGFEYSITSNSLFTTVGLPNESVDDADGFYNILAGGNLLGQFAAGSTVDFVNLLGSKVYPNSLLPGLIL